jgi:hypothetical protein
MKQSPILIAMLALAPMSDVAFAEIDCAKIPAGRERTDCYIIKGRVHGVQSEIAADKARVKANGAKLPKRDPLTAQPAPLGQEAQ